MLFRSISKKGIAAPSLTGTVTYDGTDRSVTAGEGYTLSYVLDGTAVTEARGAGTYTITASLVAGYAWDSGTDPQTYTLIIEKKAVTVKADNKSMTFKDEVPKFTAAVEGFVDGEQASLGWAPVFNSYDGAYVEEFTIVVSGDAELDNYTISYTNGIMTISKKGIAEIGRASCRERV